MLHGVESSISISVVSNPCIGYCDAEQSIETSKLKRFKEAGVTRLSMGVQALEEEDLRYLGRNHSVADALASYATARHIFDEVSFDLIYARHPRQTVDKWRAELRRALALKPSHLSLYSLTFEKGTPFYNSLMTGKCTYYCNKKEDEKLH